VVQQRPQLEAGHAAQLGQPERLASRGLYRLSSDLAESAAAGFLEHGGQLVQVRVGELSCGRRLLQQRPRAFDEHVAKQALVLRKYPIQDGQCSPLGVADLVDQAPAKARQLAQLQDRLVRHVGSPSPTNAYHVGNQPGILAIVLGLAHGRFAVGVRLQWIEDLDGMSGADQRVMQGQPVVAGCFEANRRWLGQKVEVVQQRPNSRTCIAEATRFTELPPVPIHEARLVRAFGDIDPNGDHCGDLPSRLEAGRVPDVRESSTALCVKRGGLAPHNLLMRGRSRSRAAAFLTKPKRFKEGRAAPAPSEHNPTPVVDGVERIQLTRSPHQ
jgi:hypothetical protein